MAASGSIATAQRWFAEIERWPRRPAETLLIVAFAALVLSATATREVGFTLQVSYGASALAVVAGAPVALRGWLRLPRMLRGAAIALLVVYGVAALFDGNQALAGASRSSHRALVYLADLTLGLSTVGLVVGLADTPARARRYALLLAASALLGAAYGLYQWFALRFGWPLADVNTAPNSDGYTTGHRYQGAGLLGWERVRGTFKEPLFFGVFLATGIAVASGLAGGFRDWRRKLWVAGLGLCGFVLLLTVSTLAWGVLLIAVGLVGTLSFVARGDVRGAALVAAAATVAVLLGPVVFAQPTVLASVTGRSAGDLELTTSNRTEAWGRALRAYGGRPLLGHGPGQSAVQLAYRPEGVVPTGRRAPIVLGSAQGLWASSLIDGGVLALAAWSVFLGSLLLLFARALLFRASALLVGLTTAAAVSLLAAQLSADRMDLRVWLVSGLAAAACCASGQEASARGS